MDRNPRELKHFEDEIAEMGSLGMSQKDVKATLRFLAM
jgi:hypothetical protein